MYKTDISMSETLCVKYVMTDQAYTYFSSFLDFFIHIRAYISTYYASNSLPAELKDLEINYLCSHLEPGASFDISRSESSQ